MMLRDWLGKLGPLQRAILDACGTLADGDGRVKISALLTALDRDGDRFHVEESIRALARGGRFPYTLVRDVRGGWARAPMKPLARAILARCKAVADDLGRVDIADLDCLNRRRSDVRNSILQLTRLGLFPYEIIEESPMEPREELVRRTRKLERKQLRHREPRDNAAVVRGYLISWLDGRRLRDLPGQRRMFP